MGLGGAALDAQTRGVTYRIAPEPQPKIKPSEPCRQKTACPHSPLVMVKDLAGRRRESLRELLSNPQQLQRSRRKNSWSARITGKSC
jgi:hypothetical protein